MADKIQIAGLERELNHTDLETRKRALRELKDLVEAGKVLVKKPGNRVNMHCHSFYSYNPRGFSPSRIAWEAYRLGLEAASNVDFDVLDAIDEVLQASDLLRFKFTAALESRVYVKQLADVVVNSPDEPGIVYYMGQGFVHPPKSGTRAAGIFQRMTDCANRRNRAIVDNVNNYLEDVVLDYEKDVLAFTPTGHATERHIIEVYDIMARKLISDRDKLTRFWAEKLRRTEAEIERIMDDKETFHGVMRRGLMKYGAPAYVAPQPESFPTLEETVEMIRACGAMPMHTWLDGTSPGERDSDKLLDFFCSAGSVCLNIVPERNWKLEDPDEKALKVRKFHEIIEAARKRNLPIGVGTALNSAAQPLVDDFDAPELKPHQQVFLEGARIIWGHSLLLRHGGFGYLSGQAEAAFGSDTVRKNEFFRQVGAMAVPAGATLASLKKASLNGDPKAILQILAGG